jgi:type I restriction enzyme S subunit
MVTDGYKETEIGIIPIEWESDELRNHISEMRGGAPFKPNDFTETGHLVLHKGNVIKGGKLFQKDTKYTSEKYAESHSSNIVNNKFLITTLRDLVPAGPSIGLIVKIINLNNYVLAQGAYGLKLNQSLNEEYLVQYSNSTVYRKLMQSIAVGSTQIHIRTPEFLDIKIPLPPLKEQEKIADILSTADEKIDAIASQIQKAERLKKGLLQKLLSDGIGHSEFKDSELGKIPKSWEVVKVGKICNLTAGGTPSTREKSYWYPQEVSWLSSGEVNKKKVFYTDNMISQKGLNNSSAKLLPSNSILIALAGQGKTRGTVAITEIELTTNQSVAAILPSDKIVPYYLYFNLCSRYEELRSLSTGSGGRGGLNLAILKSVNVQLPPLVEQKQIADILSTADEKLEVLRAKKKKYETLKKGLLQKLLSGEVRV